MSRHLLLTCALTAFVMMSSSGTCVFAQSLYEIRGHVLSNTDGQSVPYANCVLLNVNDSSFVKGTTCDCNGSFVMTDISSDEYLIHIQSLGFVSIYMHVSVASDVDLGGISLNRVEGYLKTVTISADKPLYSDDGEKTYYHVRDDAVAQSGTIADALQNTPGVVVDVQGNVSFQGQSSVSIWLNGKPASMDDMSLRQFLKTMPASNLDRIEVLSNPSARYDATGAIINIVTNRKINLHQLLCLGFDASTAPRISPWVSYVWATDKATLNIYINGAYSKTKVHDEFSGSGYTYDSILSYWEQYKSDSERKYLNGYTGASLEYVFNERNILKTDAWFVPNNASQILDYDVTREEYVYSIGDNSYHYNNDNIITSYNGYFNSEFTHIIDSNGQKVDFQISASRTSSLKAATISRVYDSITLGNSYLGKNAGMVSDNISFEANYFLPIPKHDATLEAGIKYNLIGSDHNVEWDSLSPLGESLNRETLRSYALNITDNDIHQYITLQKKYGKWIFKGGVRVCENWKRGVYDKLPVETDVYDVNRFFFNIMPSLNIGYRTNKNGNWRFNWTYRFSRPGTQMLSPYEILEEDSYSIGNPDLNPYYVNRLELGWMKFRKWGSVSLTGYYSGIYDKFGIINDVSYHPFFGHIVNYSTYLDGMTDRNVGVLSNLNIRPSKKVTISARFNLYDNKYRLQLRPDQWIEDGMLSYNASVNIQAKIFKYFTAYITPYYKSKTLNVMSESDANFVMNLGINAEMFDKHLSAFINISDLFNSMTQSGGYNNPYYITTNKSYFNSRQIVVGLTWRIGKMELSQKALQGTQDK